MRTRFQAVPLLFIACVQIAIADECGGVLRDSVFNSTEIRNEGANYRSFVTWQCATNYTTHDDAISGGLDVGVVVYGVPLTVGGSWGQSQKETWKTENCSSSDLKQSEESATFSLVRTVAPEIVGEWGDCMEAKNLPRALVCDLTRVGDTTVFEAKWRRTEGDDNAPTVTRWAVAGGLCEPPFAIGETFNEGARQAACTSFEDSDFVALLETQRGSCWKSVAYKPVTEVISGIQILQGNRTISAEVIDIRSDAKVVTNGYYLALAADKEIRISGSPRIVSFEGREGNPIKHGRHANTILIQTPKVSGSTLFISNHGENGLTGEKGPTGSQGPAGAPGLGGIWKNFGCTEKREAGAGGQGELGEQGLPGGDAGRGGNVTMAVSSGLSDGAIERIVVESVAAGTLGPGGPGGDGGPGGPGGNSAPPRSNVCDGVGPGPGGPQGNPGGAGPAGRAAEDGTVVNL